MAALIWLLACAPAPVAAPDPCEVAWAEMSAAGAELRALHPEARTPAREDFLAACAALPEPARRCVPLAVAAADRSCVEALDRVPAEAREAFERRLAGRSRP